MSDLSDKFRSDLISICYYLQAISPLIVGHLIFPPLSQFNPLTRKNDNPPELFRNVFSLVRDLSPRLFTNEEFILSLLFEKKNNQFIDDPDHYLNHRIITHMFLHNNYSHLIGNLLTMVFAGQPVYEELGGLQYYLIFLGGGVASSLPIYKSIQLKWNEITTPTPSSNVALSNPLGLLNQGMKHLVKKVTSLVNIGVVTCGSSGGVSALLGANFVLTIRRAVYCLADLTHLLSRNPSTDEEYVAVACRVYDLGQYALNLFHAGSFLYVEYLGFTKQLNVEAAWHYPISLFTSSKDLINHEAHFQGFLFGAGVALFAGYEQAKRSNSRIRFI